MPLMEQSPKWSGHAEMLPAVVGRIHKRHGCATRGYLSGAQGPTDRDCPHCTRTQAVAEVGQHAESNSGWPWSWDHAQASIRLNASNRLGHSFRERRNGGGRVGPDGSGYQRAVGDVEPLVVEHLAKRAGVGIGNSLRGIVGQDASAQRMDGNVVAQWPIPSWQGNKVPRLCRPAEFFSRLQNALVKRHRIAVGPFQSRGCDPSPAS